MNFRKRITGLLHKLCRSFHFVGLAVGLLFFSASLTPSLVPRAFVVQAIISGISLAIGYACGILLVMLWRYLQLPVAKERTARLALRGTLILSSILGALAIYWAASWQDSVRELMQMEPVEGGKIVVLISVSLIVFLLLLGLARLFRLFRHFVTRPLQKIVTSPIANIAGALIAAWLFWAVIDGAIFRYLMRVADDTYAALDELAGVEIPQPTEAWQTGSAPSLIDWEDMGRRGREYISSGPKQQDLVDFGIEDALEPLRVYVGLRSAETVEARAELALAELIRVGAFERSVLIVATPTGTGWLDPSAVDPLEYLHRGDVATVALQYSYLASWMSLYFEPGYGVEAARALFTTVYNYWTDLPRDRRPRLYIFGLSLGALSSERATSFYEILGDPHGGAVWVGPPFQSTLWLTITNERVPGSPVWLPRFENDSTFRFTAQRNALEEIDAAWGPMRVVYLQYASDPITFFKPSMFFRRPEWLAEPRGPDVSPKLRWFPIVTALQLGADVMLATEVPRGYGHNYAAGHYIDAWHEVTVPGNWSSVQLSALKEFFAARERAAD